MAMTCRLARDEGIFGGISSGANVLAAIAVARKLGGGGRVVTIVADSGLKYLSTDLFRPSPEKCRDICSSPTCRERGAG
jgi:cysteine synthase A